MPNSRPALPAGRPSPRHEARGSRTAARISAAGEQLGCCYLCSVGGGTRLSAELLRYDVDVSWWVTPDAYGRGYYTKVYRALRHWIATAFPFPAAHYSNAEIPPPGDG